MNEEKKVEVAAVVEKPTKGIVVANKYLAVTVPRLKTRGISRLSTGKDLTIGWSKADVKAFKQRNPSAASGVRVLIMTEGQLLEDLIVTSAKLYGKGKSAKAVENRTRAAIGDSGPGGWNQRHGMKVVEDSDRKLRLVTVKAGK